MRGQPRSRAIGRTEPRSGITAALNWRRTLATGASIFLFLDFPISYFSLAQDSGDGLIDFPISSIDERQLILDCSSPKAYLVVVRLDAWSKGAE
jgi:hypothetical protein